MTAYRIAINYVKIDIMASILASHKIMIQVMTLSKFAQIFSRIQYLLILLETLQKAENARKMTLENVLALMASCTSQMEDKSAQSFWEQSVVGQLSE